MFGYALTARPFGRGPCGQARLAVVQYEVGVAECVKNGAQGLEIPRINRTFASIILIIHDRWGRNSCI